jgi:hypothetical protein
VLDTPDDQVSERSVNFVPRRFVQLLVTAFPLSYPAIQCARSGPANSALLAPWKSAGDNGIRYVW